MGVPVAGSNVNNNYAFSRQDAPWKKADTGEAPELRGGSPSINQTKKGGADHQQRSTVGGLARSNSAGNLGDKSAKKTKRQNSSPDLGSQGGAASGAADSHEDVSGATGSQDGASGAADSQDGASGATGSQDGASGAADSQDGASGAADSQDGASGATGSQDGADGAADSQDGASGAADSQDGASGAADSQGAGNADAAEETASVDPAEDVPTVADLYKQLKKLNEEVERLQTTVADQLIKLERQEAEIKDLREQLKKASEPSTEGTEKKDVATPSQGGPIDPPAPAGNQQTTGNGSSQQAPAAVSRGVGAAAGTGPAADNSIEVTSADSAQEKAKAQEKAEAEMKEKIATTLIRTQDRIEEKKKAQSIDRSRRGRQSLRAFRVVVGGIAGLGMLIGLGLGPVGWIGAAIIGGLTFAAFRWAASEGAELYFAARPGDTGVQRGIEKLKKLEKSLQDELVTAFGYNRKMAKHYLEEMREKIEATDLGKDVGLKGQSVRDHLQFADDSRRWFRRQQGEAQNSQQNAVGEGATSTTQYPPLRSDFLAIDHQNGTGSPDTGWYQPGGDALNT